MTDVYAQIRLRPTRIGFLVKPNDMASVRAAIRLNCTLWGGVYNPIIPVFKQPPKEWTPTKRETVRGLDVAKGYIRFFEPEIFVEASAGLAKSVGLSALKSDTLMYSEVLSINKLLTTHEHHAEAELTAGQSIIDILRNIYAEEQRFKLRDSTENLFVKPEKGSCLSELLFGVYPDKKDALYFKQGYLDVFQVTETKPTAEEWIKVFLNGASCPLSLTTYNLEMERHWNHDPIISIFDPSKPTDIIDVWNSRLLPNYILPVPITWLKDLASPLKDFIKHSRRPVRGNSHGLMHGCGITFSRSLTAEECKEAFKFLQDTTDEVGRGYGHGTTPIWQPYRENHYPQFSRMKITAAEERVSLAARQEKRNASVTFRALTPKFADRFGAHLARWVNVVLVSSHSTKNIATVFPFNTLIEHGQLLEAAQSHPYRK